MRAPLTEAQASDIYDVLMNLAGASKGSRDDFIHSQTGSFVPEYRFMGTLGFGGKFWRNTSHLPDGTWGERWYVNCYQENETPERRKQIELTNCSLWELQSEASA